MLTTSKLLQRTTEDAKNMQETYPTYKYLYKLVAVGVVISYGKFVHERICSYPRAEEQESLNINT